MSEDAVAQPGAAPDVSLLVRDPVLVAQLSPDVARDLLLPVTTLAAALAVRSGQAPIGRGPELANADQVLALFGRPPAWLAEHRRALQQAGILVKPSHKVVLYRITRLRSWLTAHQVTGE